MARCLVSTLWMLLLWGGLQAHPRGGVTPNDPPVKADTTIWVDEVAILGRSLKPGRLPLAISPLSASIFDNKQSELLRLEAPKDLSLLVPNLLMPEYGSRMTSSIYVRGLGARIDQPAMGLTVDNIPVLNKDAYDLDLMDIDRMEVLRGPQSTLYGRNTIGGVMNISTRSPFDYGYRARWSYGSGNSFDGRLSSYFRLHTNEKGEWAMGLSVRYGMSDGLFTNDFTDERCDWENSGGLAIKLGYRNWRGWQIENTLTGSIVTQGGYPYRSLDEGNIAYNDPCSYERASLLEGLRVSRKWERLRLESMTSYQLLDDCMNLDQDFRPESYFTLEQDRREHALTEELVLTPVRSAAEWYGWTTGLFAFGKWCDMEAPVNFKEQGLQELIIDNVKHYTGQDLLFDQIPFPLDSDFDIQTWGAALYHESYFTLGRWSLTLGLRLDHEQARMDYRSNTRYGCRMVGTMRETVIAPFELKGRLKHSSTELLPKFSALMRMGRHRLSTLYVALSKGFKAGGFNTQMFSDVLQAALMQQMGVSFDRHYDIEKVVQYDPEISWNYELGGHLHLLQGDVKLDWSLFFIDCRNQQLTVFPPGRTTGRMMTNAGRTHSYGAELSAAIRPTRDLLLNLAYGYTHAAFREFQSGNNDYRGKRVPYAPAHTLSARLSYEVKVGYRWLEQIVPMVNLKGAGKIWWNEENSRCQPFYSLLGATIRFETAHYALDLWGNNLLNTRYDVFYFKSVGREFAQMGDPRTLGIALMLKF